MPSESILYRGLTACHAPVCCIIYKAHSTNMGINIFYHFALCILTRTLPLKWARNNTWLNTQTNVLNCSLQSWRPCTNTGTVSTIQHPNHRPLAPQGHSDPHPRRQSDRCPPCPLSPGGQRSPAPLYRSGPRAPLYTTSNLYNAFRSPPLSSAGQWLPKKRTTQSPRTSRAPPPYLTPGPPHSQPPPHPPSSRTSWVNTISAATESKAPSSGAIDQRPPHVPSNPPVRHGRRPTDRGPSWRPSDQRPRPQ